MDVATFGSTGTTSTTGLNFNSTAGLYYLGTIDNAALTRTIFNSSTLTAGVLRLNGTSLGGFGNVLVRNSASGTTLTLSGTSNAGMSLSLVNASNTVIADTGATISFGTPITQNTGVVAGLVKEGAGTITLAPVNTSSTFVSNSYTGATTINGGTINFSTSIALSTTSQINFAAGTTLAYTGTITNAGVSYSVPVTIAGTASTGGTISIGSTGTGQTLTLSGAINGAGRLFKTGAGTLILSGSDNFQGGATVSSGVLQVGSGSTNGSLGDAAGTVTLSTGTGLTFNRSNTLTVANAISGAGNITQAGGGVTVLSGSNAYTGSTTISAGTLEFQTSASLSATGAITAASGTTAAIGVGGTGQFITDAAIDSFRTSRVAFAAGSFFGIDTASATAGYSYASNITDYGATPVSIGLAKLGANTLALTGTSTYTGGTTIAAGTL